MTLGALVLYYAQGLPTTQGNQRVLIAQPNQSPHAWQAIHLDLEHLTTDHKTHPAHVFVDHRGDVHWTHLWQRQSPFTKESTLQDVVRIGLVAGEHSNRITPAQHQQARMIVDKLVREFGIDHRNVVWNDVPPPEPTHAENRPRLHSSE